MAVLKCKMCGGGLTIPGENITEKTIAVCEYCGIRQTIPIVDSEKKMTLFARANRLRLAGEFDMAAGVYAGIAAEFPSEAEAYWGLVLCRYGIEYVDDPATGKKVPTCHRSSFNSVMEDPDFVQTMERAALSARGIYLEEANTIEALRRGILEVSGREAPYDIFICYKETGENGERTPDSVLAQDVYTALTEKGYRAFFSRITLADKLGTEYEPYIFAALNSAKIMLVFGTDYEYLNAVWVKNEWSRFLSLIAAGQKKVLIPCYKDLDVYDMPRELARLQAQDMNKPGAMQDLLRGIEKILGSSTQKPPGYGPAFHASAQLDRGRIALQSREWDEAKRVFTMILDADPTCAEAYLGLIQAELKQPDEENFLAWYATRVPFEESTAKYLNQLRKYAGGELRRKIQTIDSTPESIPEEAKELMKQQKAIDVKKAQLQAEIDKLGLFAGSERRELREQISDLERQQFFIIKRIVELKEIAMAQRVSRIAEMQPLHTLMPVSS